MKALRWALVVLFSLPAAGEVLISSKGGSSTLPVVWTFDQLDAETGSYTEINAETFDIHGESGTIEEGGSFLYRTIDSGNIQIIAEVASFAGTTVVNTAAGPMIRSSLLPTARLAAAHFTVDGRTKARSRNTDDGEQITTALGSSGGAAPQCEALWFDSAASQVTYYENPGPDCDPAAAGWDIVLEDVPFSPSAPFFVGLSLLSLQVSQSVTVRFNEVQFSTTNTIVVDEPVFECSDTVNNDPTEDSDIDFPADSGCTNANDDSEFVGGSGGPRLGIVFTADFETGGVQSEGSDPDGFFIKNMGPPLGATPAGPCTKQQGFGGGFADEDELNFTRVVKSNIQAPYTGTHSLRFQINYNCDYTLLGGWECPPNPPANCVIRGKKDKARTSVHTDEVHLPLAEAVWIGFGTFFPDDWKPETSDEQASDMPIFELAMDTDNSAITIAIERDETRHPETGNQDLDGYGVTLFTQSSTSSNSLPDPEATTPRVTFDLRDIMGDWVPWVMRVVMSPDSSPQGRIDLWIGGVKIYGANVPIGACANNGTCTASSTYHPIFEIYKGDWKQTGHDSDIPSNWPIEWYLDAVRYGLEEDGAGCDDVHPLKVNDCN